MRLTVLPLLLLFVLAPDLSADVALQTSFNDITALDYQAADKRLTYGTEAQQFVDLWLPAGRPVPAPVIVLIHGGCWLAEYDISHIRPLASKLASHGFAVVAMEYRRLGQEGGGWPGTFGDISAGLEFIASLEDDRLDLSRIILVGHSAGGHLALWAAGRSLLDETQQLYEEKPFMPRGIIGLAAISDLAAYSQGNGSCQAATQRLMGGLPAEQPDRYEQGSPAQLGTAIPAILIHGDQDPIVPISQARALPRAKLVMIEGAGHFDLIHPGTVAFPQLLAQIQEMLAP